MTKATHHNNNTPSLATQLPKYIDLAKWENAPETHTTWQGDVPLGDFKRLSALKDTQKSQDDPLQVTVEFFQKNAVLWATLHTRGTLWQTCQRCLEPVAISLAYDNSLALLKSDSDTILIDDDTDFVLLDELPHDTSQSNGSDKKLLLLPFIEDELLVQLPLSPKHENCEMAVTEVGEYEEAVQENPFAMLASLKGKLPS